MGFRFHIVLRRGRSFLLRSTRGLLSWLRVVNIRLAGGVDIPFGAEIDKGVFVQATDGGFISVGKGGALSRQIQLVAQGGRISIGSNCFIGPGCVIVSKDAIVIGDDVSFPRNFVCQG